MNQTNKILLVLDLDETLIHATSNPKDKNHQFSFDKYVVYERPFLKHFLERVSEHYDLAIWSSANEIYIEKIMELSVLNSFNFKFIWGRSRCTKKRNLELDEYVHEKKLMKLKKKYSPLEKTLIVDDSSEKVKENYGNAIYIQAFEGNQNDIELKKLLKYLESIKDVSNVRTIEKRGWRNLY